MAALAKHIPVRLHLRQFVLQVGEQTAKARCDNRERRSGPVPPSPPGSPLQIRKQTFGPPSPFVAVLTKFVLFTFSWASMSFIARSSASTAATRVNREGCTLCSGFVEHPSTQCAGWSRRLRTKGAEWNEDVGSQLQVELSIPLGPT